MNTSKYKTVRMFSQVAALVSLLALTGACNVQPASLSPSDSGQALEQDARPTPEFDTVEIESDGQVSPGDLELPKQNACPGLESMLFQITQAPDPLDLAKQLQLKVKGDKIQVLLVLDREDTGFLQNFKVEVGTQSGTKVQALVPINLLCDLANTDEVLAIRLPARAVPQ